MKKFILIFLVVVCLGGIGYLGYVIFNAKSIKTVEIAGNMQTLYIVGEDIDFQDAQLKVTYKNGDIKMVDLNEKNVDVTLFSTSLQTHGKMKLIYKSEILEVEYDVIGQGLYYLSEESVMNAADEGDTTPTPVTYDLSKSATLFNIGPSNQLQSYYKSTGVYYMHDGFMSDAGIVYDPGYRYEIVSDTLNVYLGQEQPTYSLKALYNTNGTLQLKDVKYVTQEGREDMPTRKEEKLFKLHEGYKTDRRIKSVEVDLSNTSTFSESTYKYIKFTVNQNIKTSEKVLLLTVNYSNDSFMSSVKLYITDNMVTRSSLDTSKVSTGINHMLLRYEGQDFDINYKVLN